MNQAMQACSYYTKDHIQSYMNQTLDLMIETMQAWSCWTKKALQIQAI